MSDKEQPGNCQVLEAETPALKNQPQWKNSQGCATVCGKERTDGKKDGGKEGRCTKSKEANSLSPEFPNQEF